MLLIGTLLTVVLKVTFLVFFSHDFLITFELFYHPLFYQHIHLFLRRLLSLLFLAAVFIVFTNIFEPNDLKASIIPTPQMCYFFPKLGSNFILNSDCLIIYIIITLHYVERSINFTYQSTPFKFSGLLIGGFCF